MKNNTNPTFTEQVIMDTAVIFTSIHFFAVYYDLIDDGYLVSLLIFLFYLFVFGATVVITNLIRRWRGRENKKDKPQTEYKTELMNVLFDEFDAVFDVEFVREKVRRGVINYKEREINIVVSSASFYLNIKGEIFSDLIPITRVVTTKYPESEIKCLLDRLISKHRTIK